MRDPITEEEAVALMGGHTIGKVGGFRFINDVCNTWLPDGYSQIFDRMFLALGTWSTMALQRYAAKFDPLTGSDFAIWQP